MKFIKIVQKSNSITKTNFYAFKEFIKLEVDNKFLFLKLHINFDVVEGDVENFDVKKFERFIKSDANMIFEIMLNEKG
jgi:hypothetical protein